MSHRQLRFWFVLSLTSLLVIGGWWWTRTARNDAVDTTRHGRSFDPDALVRQAAAAVDRGESRTARSLIDEVLEQNPAHSAARLYSGLLFRDSGQLASALGELVRVADQPIRFGATARFLEGTVHLQRNRAREAESALTRAVQLRPDALEPLEELARLYSLQLRAGRLRCALIKIRRIRLWSGDELLLFLMAHQPVVGPPANIRRLRAFVAEDTADVDSQLALARTLMLHGQHDEADLVIRSCLSQHPTDARFVSLLAESLLQRSDFEAATKVLNTAAASDSSTFLAWKARGILLFESGDWNAAATALKMAVARHPEDPAVVHRLGLALSHLGQVEAEDWLRQSPLWDRLIEQAPLLQRRDHAQSAAVEVGRLLTQLGRPAMAALCFDHANQQNGGLRGTHDRLRKALADAKTNDLASLLEQMEQDLCHDDVATELTHSESPPDLELTAPSAAGNSQSTNSTSIRLIDRHAEAGLHFQFEEGDNWPKWSLLQSTGGGVAVLDYDLDGWPDLFFPQGCRMPIDSLDFSLTDRLYRNRGDGTFDDVTKSSGLGDNGYGQGCTAGDFDNDGDPDLFVTRFGTNVAYENNGDGTFTEITVQTGLAGDHWSTSLALADLDGDGLLDLYITNYVIDPGIICRGPDGRPVTCSPGSFTAVDDEVRRNNGDGSLTDVTTEWGFRAAAGRGLGVVVSDLNADNLPDIYVANDQTPNLLFRNAGPDDNGQIQFHEVGLLSGTATSSDGKSLAGMGIACGDFNSDLRPDLFVTNFRAEIFTLYINEGNLLFRDTTRTYGLAAATVPMLGFGTQAIDFNLNGWPDLFVTNGHVDPHPQDGSSPQMSPQLFLNGRDGTFVDVSDDVGPFFEGKFLGRAAARIDFNRDGLPDVVVVHQDRPVGLLQNQSETTNRSLTLKLHGTSSNRDAVGAKITATVADRKMFRELVAGDGYFCRNQREIILGTGSAKTISLLEITWPDGTKQQWADLPTETTLQLVQGRTEAMDDPVGRDLQRNDR
jgi:tetratricopeptide (TPR) repeat protein